MELAFFDPVQASLLDLPCYCDLVSSVNFACIGCASLCTVMQIGQGTPLEQAGKHQRIDTSRFLKKIRMRAVQPSREVAIDARSASEASPLARTSLPN
jgi:hypothetical protein